MVKKIIVSIIFLCVLVGCATNMTANRQDITTEMKRQIIHERVIGFTSITNVK